jgi:hypothetical protein
MKALTVRVVAGLALASPLRGQQPAAPAAQDLARQLANPVASLISVPFQANWDVNVGPGEDTRFLLNFQPVMPFSLNEKWNLIARVIVPVLSQPPLAAGGSAAFGLSDILLSGFFSPKVSDPIWGVGPVLQLPVSSEPTLGTERWSVGPTIVVLKQSGQLTFGLLANHLWSVAGDATRADVNQTYLQPFLSRTSAGGVTVTLSSESAGNWEAPSGQEWTVPLILQVSKVTRLGRRPISVGLGGGYYVETPAGQPDWRLRMLFVLLFPAR